MFLTSMQIAKEAKMEIDLDTLQSACGSCGLYKDCRTPKMKVSGEGRKKILIVGDRLSESDDMNAMHFSGESGKYFQKLMQKNGISLNKDCWKTSAIRCASSKVQARDANVSAFAKNCSGYLQKLLYTLKPKFVILFGDAAITSVLGEDFKNRSVIRWRGVPFYDRKYDTTFFCTFSPKDVVVGKYDSSKTVLFEKDIAKAISHSDINRRDITDYEQYVKHLLTFKEASTVLDRVYREKRAIYFDLETSGLKPYRPGHFIATFAFAVSETEAYALPLDFNNYWKERDIAEIKRKLNLILEDPKIPKSGQNDKFEDCWCAQKLTKVNGWHWDTMIASHIIDNRSEWTNLKFQTFLNFGVRPYDEHIEKYIKTKNEEFNSVHKAPLGELLTYNGLDCIFGLKIQNRQKEFFADNKGLLNANTFLFNGTFAMSRIQQNGIEMDEKYYKNTREQLTFKINKLLRELKNGNEAKLFSEKFGRPLNIASGGDLGKLFYEVLEHKAVYTGKTNAKGVQNYKTDKDTLAKLGISFTNKLNEAKKLTKARDTYLAQFNREVFDGMMHPFFDLHIPVTYRSSSSKPNFQNLPKRDEEIKNAVRMGITAGTGDDVLSEIDFSGAEVITSVCYHKDPTFLAYLLDKSTDMHRDQAIDLWQLPEGMLSDPSYTRDQAKKAKKIRFFAKNNWTFAEFYGDWYDSCARNLWENCIIRDKLELPNGTPLIEHCIDVGIYTVEDFIEHCHGVEDRLWNERFPEYTKWKQNIYKFYLKYGYIETFYGFKFTGYMDRKQATNYPIQGTSFHNLINVLLDVEKFLWKYKLKTKLIGQIHDSIIAKVPKQEIEFYHRGVSAIINNLHKKINWLIVPMEAECAISKLGRDGGNLSKLFEIKPMYLDGTKKFDLPAIYK